MAEEINWWASLRHGGLLIAPSRLVEYFPAEPKPLPPYSVEQIRRALTRLEAQTREADREFLDLVLEHICGLAVRWEKGTQVDKQWSHQALTGESVKPRRVWYGAHDAKLPVFVTDDTRLGIGRGRRMVSRVVEWLRNTGLKLALLTNIRQFRLIHAGLDYEAFAEWDTDLWFEEGQAGPQITALQLLLSPEVLQPQEPNTVSPLLAAIQASRRGQAELSAELGERVRQAVELLIQTFGSALDSLESEVSPRHIYLAATRLVMRMVVVLFAEARDLLPRENGIYHQSYGIQGLRETLDRLAGGAGKDRLRYRFGAWPRILGLFRLVFEGSHHQGLPIPRYGGALFFPGQADSQDPVSKALAIFENPGHAQCPSDAIVHQIIELLCRTRVKVRQGRTSTWIQAPVDFSDLSSEYIGILYEGLLDYELRRAEEPVIFLALGDEPALPLPRLETMDEASLAQLVAKFKVKKKLAVAEEDNDEEEDDAENLEEAEEEKDSEEEDAAAAVEKTIDIESEDPGSLDSRRTAREQAHQWAQRAVKAGKFVPRPRGKNTVAHQKYEEAVGQTAQNLITKIVLSGEWYLVRWGGTRKGSGTFYTRPQLAVPTVHRTLRPLAYIQPSRPDETPNEDASASVWLPKLPEEILALKVCDPAAGSGSFLVASLRFLTEALFASLHHHHRIQNQGDNTHITLAEGTPTNGSLWEDHLPTPPDAPDFEKRLHARLKRYVVERCLYGVDFDPLAIELAKLSLWIETMDKDLPFEFLDHKLKVGNSLVGCWFDQFRDYPALAWEREGGDKNHSNGIHYKKEAWTKAIKKFRNDHIKQELAAWISGQRSLLDELEGKTPETLHDEAVEVFSAMQGIPIHEPENRASYYRDRILNNSQIALLKEAFDTWCAIWFWPPDVLQEIPTPRTFENTQKTTQVPLKKLKDEFRFFHWELEFPDVFATAGGGFDAVVGNPPWEVQKPNSKEYFSNLDPLYRAYGKQVALAKQKELFQVNSAHELDWLKYNAAFKANANFGKYAGLPFGDPTDNDEVFSLGRGSDKLHNLWRKKRSGRTSYADPIHPYRYQGTADINTYKRFLEQSYALLRKDGCLGMLVPSGIYTDKGSTPLRTLFLSHCRWHWLFGFENREGIFDIHRSFKFCPIILQKGEQTDAIQTAFMRRDVSDWEEAENFSIPYSRKQVERFSPHTKAILEIRSKRDLQILEKIYSNAIPLGDQGAEGWGINYATEFHMTNDSKLFPPRPTWETKGYQPDQYGRWVGPEGDIALPLYEGRMIGQFDFSQKGWISGKGRSAEWREIPWEEKVIEPQFLMSRKVFHTSLTEDYLESFKMTNGEEETKAEEDRLKDPKYWWEHVWQTRCIRAGFMDIASATNKRTMISTLIYGFPCGNKVPIFYSRENTHALILIGVLNSFSYDYQMRVRLGGLTLNYFIVAETSLIKPSNSALHWIGHLIRCLCWTNILFAPLWFKSSVNNPSMKKHSWKKLWGITLHERLRLRCLLDALVAELYGLNWDDLAWILRDCDYPTELSTSKTFAKTLDPKGFWRVDKEKAPELRHTVLTLVAFHNLKETIAAHGGNCEAGIEAFCTQNDGDGWMIPETVCLNDFGLGHDLRDKEPQPVRARLGERFLPWQLEQSVEESWAECEQHAHKILGEEGFALLQAELHGEQSEKPVPSRNYVVAENLASYQTSGNLDLFGELKNETSGNKDSP